MFVVGRSTWAIVSVVNVLLIFGSLYFILSPTEDESHESTDAKAEEETVESAA